MAPTGQQEARASSSRVRRRVAAPLSTSLAAGWGSFFLLRGMDAVVRHVYKARYRLSGCAMRWMPLPLAAAKICHMVDYALHRGATRDAACLRGRRPRRVPVRRAEAGADRGVKPTSLEGMSYDPLLQLYVYI